MLELTTVFMLMVAPSITDIDVENNAHQINATQTLEQCEALISNQTDSRHYWCEAL